LFAIHLKGDLMARFFMSFSLLFLTANAFSQTPIDGVWTLTSRVCESGNPIEKITFENSTVFDTQKNTYTFKMKVGKDCVLEKVGPFYLEENNGSYFATVCLPKAQTTGTCDQTIIDHANQINQETSACQDPVHYELTDANKKLRFFEMINLPNMFCEVGEKLFYNYERQ
jgi:hypothetical protein